MPRSSAMASLWRPSPETQELTGDRNRSLNVLMTFAAERAAVQYAFLLGHPYDQPAWRCSTLACRRWAVF